MRGSSAVLPPPLCKLLGLQPAPRRPLLTNERQKQREEHLFALVHKDKVSPTRTLTRTRDRTRTQTQTPNPNPNPNPDPNQVRRAAEKPDASLKLQSSVLCDLSLDLASPHTCAVSSIAARSDASWGRDQGRPPRLPRPHWWALAGSH